MVVYANTVTYMYMYIVACLVPTYVHNRRVRRKGGWEGEGVERGEEGEREGKGGGKT